MTPSRGISIGGMGIVSALGIGRARTVECIRRREDRSEPVNLFPHAGAGDFPACAVADFPEDLEHRCDELAVVAIEEALDEAGLAPHGNRLRDCALLLGNTSVDLLELEGKARACFAQGIPYPPTIFGTGGNLGEMAERIAHRVGIGGPVISYNTSCSASANAICQAERMLQTERVRLVLVVGVESMTATSYYGFAALSLLDPKGCRPFDRDRQGIQLGEGAAALLLDCEGDSGRPRLLSGANVFDAYHPTTICPDGAACAQAMQPALNQPGVEASRIEAIKAHGTGSPNNDLAEGTALAAVFGGAAPPFTSLKRYFGHTLGASGALELVAFVECVRHGFVPASLGYSSVDPDLAVAPTREHVGTDGGLFLLNSFGFGGSFVSLVLRASAPGGPST